MSDDSGSDSGNNSSNDSSSSSDSSRDSLAAHRNHQADTDPVTRANAGTKDTGRSDSETYKKGADKNPSGGNEILSADDVSIPSSVDPDAPSNSGGDSSDNSTSSESSE